MCWLTIPHGIGSDHSGFILRAEIRTDCAQVGRGWCADVSECLNKLLQNFRIDPFTNVGTVALERLLAYTAGYSLNLHVY